MTNTLLGVEITVGGEEGQAILKSRASMRQIVLGLAKKKLEGHWKKVQAHHKRKGWAVTAMMLRREFERIVEGGQR